MCSALKWGYLNKHEIGMAKTTKVFFKMPIFLSNNEGERPLEETQIFKSLQV